MQTRYETGMQITYEPSTQEVTVTFRGRIFALPGTYPDRQQAISAAEQFCRNKGWDNAPNRRGSRAGSFRSLF